MRKVSGSIPDGVQDNKEKKTQEAWVIWGRKRGEIEEVGKQRMGEKKRAIKSSFIHTVSTN